ncbi:MAG TPA: manganese efflux pump [Candidatus Cybelea sp.]|jgi:putative Mn2+ efflux pump MntP
MRRAGLPIVLVLAVVTFVGVAVVLRAYAGLTVSVEAKVLGIAFAVGLDVLALSIAVGIMQVGAPAKLRLALAFSFAEVLMQLVGYGLGTGAGRVVGSVAIYVGFAILAGVGIFIIRESFEKTAPTFKADSGWGLVAACASISLDSLGIGVSLPGVPLPLGPLLATIAVSTVVFTTMGLAFGERMGRRYRQKAQRAAGIVLVILAVFFTIQHIVGWSA